MPQSGEMSQCRLHVAYSNRNSSVLNAMLAVSAMADVQMRALGEWALLSIYQCVNILGQ